MSLPAPANTQNANEKRAPSFSDDARVLASNNDLNWDRTSGLRIRKVAPTGQKNPLVQLLTQEPIERTELRATLKVHRNTLAKWEREALTAGLIERVGTRSLRAISSMPAAPVTQPTSTEDTTAVLLMKLAHLESKLEKALTLLAQIAVTNTHESAHSGTIESAQTAQFCTVGSAQTAQFCTVGSAQTAQFCTIETPLARVYAGAFPLAVMNCKNNCSSNAGEEVHIEKVHTPEVHTQTPSPVEEPSASEAVEDRKAQNRKRFAFQRAYETIWRERFKSNPEPIGVLSSMRLFVASDIAALTEDEWCSSVTQWLDNPRMARQGWPVRFLVAGINGEFSPATAASVPCPAASEGTETECSRWSELQAEGWLKFEDWRDWELLQDLPTMASRLFALRFAWNGVSGVWAPIRARIHEDTQTVTLIAHGNQAGQWSLEVLELLQKAARVAGYTLQRVISPTGYIWWECPDEPSLATNTATQRNVSFGSQVVF